MPTITQADMQDAPRSRMIPIDFEHTRSRSLLFLIFFFIRKSCAGNDLRTAETTVTKNVGSKNRDFLLLFCSVLFLNKNKNK